MAGGSHNLSSIVYIIIIQGIVDIYTSFNLTRVKRVRNAHSTFITGLEFLSSSDTAAVVRGFREASVVSISVDHQVSVCKQNTDRVQ